MYAADAEADGTLFGAYGPRLFKGNAGDQVQNVIRVLKDDLPAFSVPGDLRDFPWTEGAEDGETYIHA